MLSHYWKNLGSSPISLQGDLKTVFVGRWSIGNVQMIYLWYDRFISNPNSFDVSRTNHCDIELDISMFLVHLDRPLQCKQCWRLTISTPCASPAGIHQNRWKVPSTGVCVNDEKRNYTVWGWREIMMSAQYPVRKCTFLSTSNTFASFLWPKEGVVAMTSPSNRQFNWL